MQRQRLTGAVEAISNLPSTTLVLAALVLMPGGCVRAPEPAADGAPTATSSPDSSIAADRPERLLMPHAPLRPGEMVIERVAPLRAQLELPPPPAEPGEPPPAAEAAEGGVADESRELKPPIARGLPRSVRGGSGGRVSLDVRVDESGEVSDALLVESTGDSVAVEAALAAAREMRYHPALLGTRRVAVWCRQVFDVLRAR